jgi:pimeloyl-ACP methyl ester carboxylesterase
MINTETFEPVRFEHVEEPKRPIVFAHGAGQRGDHFLLLRNELEKLGHQTFAPDLDCDKRRSHDHNARILAKVVLENELEGAVMAANSRGGNSAIRAPREIYNQSGKQPVDILFLFSAALDPKTIRHLVKTKDPIPEDKGIMYDMSLKKKRFGFTEFSPNYAKMSLYSNSVPVVQDWAVGMLRKQYRPKRETCIESRPNCYTIYTVLTKDLAIPQIVQRIYAEHLFEADKIIEYKSDHTPHLSKARAFAFFMSKQVQILPVYEPSS